MTSQKEGIIQVYDYAPVLVDDFLADLKKYADLLETVESKIAVYIPLKTKEDGECVCLLANQRAAMLAMPDDGFINLYLEQVQANKPKLLHVPESKAQRMLKGVLISIVIAHELRKNLPAETLRVRRIIFSGCQQKNQTFFFLSEIGKRPEACQLSPKAYKRETLRGVGDAFI